MTLLDWRQHHLWIRRNRQFLPSQRVSEVISAEIVALPERRFPRAAAQPRIVSVARIRVDLPKSVRPFKGIFCNDVSEFESYMPSQAVGLHAPVLFEGRPAAESRCVSAPPVMLR